MFEKKSNEIEAVVDDEAEAPTNSFSYNNNFKLMLYFSLELSSSK